MSTESHQKIMLRIYDGAAFHLHRDYVESAWLEAVLEDFMGKSPSRNLKDPTSHLTQSWNM